RVVAVCTQRVFTVRDLFDLVAPKAQASGDDFEVVRVVVHDQDPTPGRRCRLRNRAGHAPSGHSAATVGGPMNLATSATTVRGSQGFVRYPSHPTSRARRRCMARAWAVRATTGISAVRPSALSS